MIDIRYDLRDYRDLYAKLRRDVARFNEEPCGDHLFNAMVTAWCLADWLVADLPNATNAMLPGLRALAGKAPGETRNNEHLDPVMQLCRDIAEASKHGKLSRSSLVVRGVRATNGTLGGGFLLGFSRLNDRKHRYAVFADGGLHDAEDILAKVLALYDAFLAEHNLLDVEPAVEFE